MQDFYPDISKENYEEQALNKAVALFFELAGETKEAFLAYITKAYGTESYDLLKNYSGGLKLLGKGFPAQYKRQVLVCILPFLPKAQALELIILRIKQAFLQMHQQGSHSYSATTFYKLFARYLNSVVYDVHEHIKSHASLYAPYEDELPEIFAVEKYLFLQKMEILYQDYVADMSVVWESMQHKKSSLENVTYFLPYLNAKLYLVYTATDDKGNETIHMSFSPKEIKRVEQNTQGLLDFLQNEKREKDLDYFFSKNVLPTLQGIFKEELQNYIAEQELATEYHTKSTEGISLLAKHDMQNVLQTYEKSNKITQTMELSLKLDLRAGKLQAGINTQVYRKKIWNIMGGIGFSLFFCIIGFSVNLGIHTIIGVLFLAYNLYELWKVLAQKG